MECSDCEELPCICEEDSTKSDILYAVLDLMEAKMLFFGFMMQNRVHMIKEDIISTITEEKARIKQVISSKIINFNSTEISFQENNELETINNSEILEVMNFLLDFNVNNESMEIGFGQALEGNYVFFRELLKRKPE
jgi:uncharacterized protein YabE (DUF348 family)